MCRTREKVTIEFAGDAWAWPESHWALPGSQPDGWPQTHTQEIRLVESETDAQRTFTLYGGRLEQYTLTAEETEHLLRRLARMEVAAPWRPLCGCDGTDRLLTLKGAMSSMTFYWWDEVPPEWDRVGEVFEYVTHLAFGRDPEPS